MNPRRHLVVTIGGAVSGAEAAATLAATGIDVVVLEQNPRPYGKIEDGLPRWHVEQRRAEFERIRRKLSLPQVRFVPCTRLGRDVDFAAIVGEWRPSAVILATGAQRDRPVGVAGLDDFEGRGLLYQSSLVRWFNHHQEAGYDGPRYTLEDGAVVLGGGLASFDVVKILMLETVASALAARGHEVDVVTMERAGIAATLSSLGLTLEALGLSGCTLYYRREAREMPVAAFRDGATEQERHKTEEVRERLLHLARAKYLFGFEPCRVASGFESCKGHVSAVRFARTRTVGGDLELSPGSEYLRPTRLIVGSIGSLPEPLHGVPLAGDLYDFDDVGTARLRGYPNVFGVGNVVTGRGNIAVSRRHGALVAEQVARDYLGLGGVLSPGEGTLFGAVESRAAEQALRVVRAVQATPGLSEADLARIDERVRALQTRVGYPGDLGEWLARVTPADLR